MQHGLASSTQGFVETSSRPGDILEAGFLSLQRRKNLPFIPIVWGMIQTVQEEILEKNWKFLHTLQVRTLYVTQLLIKLDAKCFIFFLSLHCSLQLSLPVVVWM